ncbi:hypothetical protein [Thaumasiovibrio subtropicus]|uniref:hypothetical protein n=1 Tax=Thaumasiovibrio subtropicus TaxID=1891207 RepID=UPI000B351BA3|nr:hypothetical protein [Thaumasiovibrio subtropicus]
MDVNATAIPMAISAYLGVIIAMILLYPFLLVGIQIAIYEKGRRDLITKRFNWICILVFGVMLYLHMQTEVHFGQALIDAWNAANPTVIEPQ